jgi:crotonobetainyl-CoA:carnitine CoA-transferase CaiB-like acyl-CoA transferase
VLDLSRVLAGPVCCQTLADLGADVVKVERPGRGDDTRQWGPPFLGGGDDPASGPSAYFLSCNRNKRSAAIDLALPEGRALIDEFIQRADVLVENFLPDALDKFGLRPERLRALNPRLVVASISGFGRTGPKAAAPGYDAMIQAAAGLASITGEVDGEPMKTGVAVSDVITGLYAAVSVLAGLHARDAAGGMAFDLALADCTLASLVNVAQGVLATGKRPVRYGNAHPQIVPYQTFATADGHVVLAVGADRQWRRFCSAIGRDELAADARYETNALRVQNRGELIALLAAEFAKKTTAQWLALLEAAEIPHSPVRSVDEALADEQTVARKMTALAVDQSGRDVRLLASPIHWQDEPPPRVSPPPDLGQHTDEILAEWLGYDKARIEQLRKSGAIA